MKKFLLIGLIIVLFLNTNIFASNADLFAYNNEAIEAEFAQLNTLESYVSVYDVTLKDLKANNSFILTELHFNNADMSRPLGMMFGFDDMDWGSFAWGVCCFPVGAAIGVFTVLLDDDKGHDSKISYLIGAGVGFVLSGGLYKTVYIRI